MRFSSTKETGVSEKRLNQKTGRQVTVTKNTMKVSEFTSTLKLPKTYRLQQYRSFSLKRRKCDLYLTSGGGMRFVFEDKDGKFRVAKVEL